MAMKFVVTGAIKKKKMLQTSR